MRNSVLLAATLAGTMTAAVLGGSGNAQPFEPKELLRRGNDSLKTNCVESAMNYYAILQQYPGWPNAAAVALMRSRIEGCRNGSVGLSSVGWIGKAAPQSAASHRPLVNSAVTGSARPVAVGRSGASAAAAPAPASLPDMSPITAPNEDLAPRARACRAYAAASLLQAQTQAEGQCGESGMRWAASYDVHYGWCMEAASPGDLQREIDERAQALNACIFRW